jgi:hypothetical protein
VPTSSSCPHLACRGRLFFSVLRLFHRVSDLVAGRFLAPLARLLGIQRSHGPPPGPLAGPRLSLPPSQRASSSSAHAFSLLPLRPLSITLSPAFFSLPASAAGAPAASSVLPDRACLSSAVFCLTFCFSSGSTCHGMRGRSNAATRRVREHACRARRRGALAAASWGCLAALLTRAPAPGTRTRR